MVGHFGFDLYNSNVTSPTGSVNLTLDQIKCLDDIKAVHEALRLPKPQPINFLENPKNWWDVRGRIIFFFALWTLPPTSAIYFFARAISEDNLTFLWVAVGFSGLFFVGWLLHMLYQFASELRSAQYEVVTAIIENSDRETEILKQILVYEVRVLEHVHDQYETTPKLIGGRSEFLVGGIRQTGVIATLIALIGGYVGILKDIPEIKNVSL